MVSFIFITCLIILTFTAVIVAWHHIFTKKDQKAIAMKEIHEMLQVSRDIDKRVIHVENRMEEYALEIESLKKEIKRLKSKNKLTKKEQK